MTVSVGHSQLLASAPPGPRIDSMVLCYPSEAHQCTGHSVGKSQCYFPYCLINAHPRGHWKGSQEDGATPVFKFCFCLFFETGFLCLALALLELSL